MQGDEKNLETGGFGNLSREFIHYLENDFIIFLMSRVFKKTYLQRKTTGTITPKP